MKGYEKKEYGNYGICLSATNTEFLDAFIVSFDDKDAALLIDNDAYRIIQLAVCTASNSPFGHEYSIRIKLLYPVIGRISNIDIIHNIEK